MRCRVIRHYCQKAMPRARRTSSISRHRLKGGRYRGISMAWRSRVCRKIQVPANMEHSQTRRRLNFSLNSVPQRYGWCCWRGLNSRPLPYQGSALPLSYNSQGPSARLPLAPGRGVPQPLDAGRACCQVHGHGKARQIPAQTRAVARRKARRSAAGESAPPQGPSTGQGCGGSRAPAAQPGKSQGIKPGFPQRPIWAICQPKGQRPQA